MAMRIPVFDRLRYGRQPQSEANSHRRSPQNEVFPAPMPEPPNSVPQHVREDGEGHTGTPAEALEQRAEALGRHWAAALTGEHVWRCLLLTRRRRRARISSPCIGCTEGVPFLLLRTCSRPGFFRKLLGHLAVLALEPLGKVG